MSLTKEIPQPADPIDIIESAKKWCGTPYRHQASAFGQGADCLGLVRGVWRDVVGVEPVNIPPYSPDWVELRQDDPLLAAAQKFLLPIDKKSRAPGHVLLFRIMPGSAVKHMGIQSSEHRFIHAYAGQHVCENWLSSWWRSRLVAVFAFPKKEIL